MNSPQSVSLQCVCAILGFAAVSAAKAQDEPDWLFHVRAGAMVGFNIKANFNTSGQFNLAENAAPGTYDDGYVHPDQTGNAGGLTSFWGYQNGSQVESASHSLLMHQTTTFSATSSGSGNDAPYFGGELAGGASFWHGEHWRAGVELGVGVLPISIKNQQGFPVTVNRNIFSFDTGNIVVPAAPYNGGASGVGPLINATPTQLSGDSSAGAFTGTQTLDTTLVAIRLGPTFSWEVNRYLGFQASAGPAVGILPGTLKFDEAVQLPDGTIPHNSGQVSSTEVTFGGYVNVIATFQVHTNADVYIGAQYLPLGNVTFGGGGRNAELDLTGQINVMAGLNWHF